MKKMTRLASALLALLLVTGLSVPFALAADSYYEATVSTKVYSGPEDTFDVVVSLPKGDVVVVTSMWPREWWKVKYTNSSDKTYEGYVSSSLLKESKKRKNEKKDLRALGCYKTLMKLSLHAEARAGSKEKTSVPKGNVVKVTDTKDEDWSRCTFINSKGKSYTGYLLSEGLKKAPEPYNTTAQTPLRKSASSSAKTLATMGKGAYVFVSSMTNKTWAKVKYTTAKGKSYTGYVLRSKIKKGTITNKPYKQVEPKTADSGDSQTAELWRTKSRYILTAKTTLTKSASAKGKKVADLSKGTVVAVTGSSGSFYKVLWNNSKNEKKSGYLPKSKLKAYTDPEGGEYLTLVRTQLRKTDDMTGTVLADLDANTMVTVNDTSEKDWYWVSYTDGNGKVSTGFLFKSHAKKYIDTNGGDYYTVVDTVLRQTDSNTGKVLLSLPKGVWVQVKKTYNPDWYYVTCIDVNGNSTSGYVDSQHLQRFQSGNTKYSAIVDTVLRVQPDYSSQVLSKVAQGQVVTVRDAPMVGWYWASVTDSKGITYNGFISSSHLALQ